LSYRCRTTARWWLTSPSPGRPATGPQQSYLSTLAQQKGEDVDPTELTKAEASQEIDRLRAER
jgi:hypothetical protein